MVFRFSLFPLLAAIAKDRCDSPGLVDTGGANVGPTKLYFRRNQNRLCRFDIVGRGFDPPVKS
jgi:hypothetical protein